MIVSRTGTVYLQAGSGNRGGEVGQGECAVRMDIMAHSLYTSSRFQNNFQG